MAAVTDTQVLDHITTYPGLSTYHIARALGLVYRDDHAGHTIVNKDAIERALGRLEQAGLASSEMVPFPCPGRAKKIWRRA